MIGIEFVAAMGAGLIAGYIIGVSTTKDINLDSDDKEVTDYDRLS